MFQDDLNYYRRRAELELEQARAATVPTVAATHRRLADAYLERVDAIESGHPARHD